MAHITRALEYHNSTKMVRHSASTAQALDDKHKQQREMSNTETVHQL